MHLYESTVKLILRFSQENEESLDAIYEFPKTQKFQEVAVDGWQPGIMMITLKVTTIFFFLV